MARGLLIVGGGGHALVVAEAAVALGMPLSGFLDDDPGAVLGAGSPRCERLGGLADAAPEPVGAWIIGLGRLGLRREWIERWGQNGASTVVHTRAVIAPSAQLGAGVFAGPGAVVHTRARVAAHAIINSGAVVEHECDIGENAHIAPGAVLGGRVRIGRDTLVGLGARVLPGVRIGAGCLVGAGAVVTRDVADHGRVAGIPATTLP